MNLNTPKCQYQQLTSSRIHCRHHYLAVEHRQTEKLK